MEGQGRLRCGGQGGRGRRALNRLACWLLLGLWAEGLAAEEGKDGSQVRQATGHGVSLTVTALKPSQKTAFYLARGFTAEQIAPYAEGCGFSFSFENRERSSLNYRLAEWTAEIAVEGAGQVRHFTPLAHWEAHWQRLGVAGTPRIAFRWAQFAEEQEFARGDWIMGMVHLTAAPGTRFRLVARFHDGGKTLELPMDDVPCAPLE